MRILTRRRKTETLTITHELVRILRPKSEMIAWCRECACQTLMLLPEEAASRTGVSTREIYRRVETGAIHFTETSMGSLLVCINSIAQQVSEAKNELLT